VLQFVANIVFRFGLFVEGLAESAWL
jgi:hypothetical protein